MVNRMEEGAEDEIHKYIREVEMSNYKISKPQGCMIYSIRIMVNNTVIL